MNFESKIEAIEPSKVPINSYLVIITKRNELYKLSLEVNKLLLPIESHSLHTRRVTLFEYVPKYNHIITADIIGRMVICSA